MQTYLKQNVNNNKKQLYITNTEGHSTKDLLKEPRILDEMFE